MSEILPAPRTDAAARTGPRWVSRLRAAAWALIGKQQDAPAARGGSGHPCSPTVSFQCRQDKTGRLRYTHLDPGAAALFGLEPAALGTDPSRPWQLLGTPSALPTEGPWEASVIVGGQERWLRTHSTRSMDHHGHIVHDGVWTDVTREHEARGCFEVLLDQSPCPSLLLDAHGLITGANPAALALFASADVSALQGKALGQPPLVPPTTAVPWARPGEGGSPASGPQPPHSFLRLDGSRFEGQLTLAVLPGTAQGPRWLALLEDITARQRTEDALRRAHEAEQSAVQAKSAFLSNISHEIRTPMNAIIGMTHLALQDPDTSKHRGYVTKAHQAAKSLLEITNDILDLARIESGQLEMECVEFGLQGVIDHLGNVLGMEAERKGLELLFAASPDLPTRLLGDPTRLRQILLHLGSNAVKFTDRGSVTIGLEVQQRQGVEIELHGWVRDTGIGISEDRRATLFQPFTQADNSTTRRFGGSGLGLSICHHLVRRMNGRLWVDSEPGQGSTFHFTLRLHLPSGLAPSDQLRDDWTGKRALLADDNADAREVLGTMLRHLGVKVDVVAGGTEALARLEEAAEPYDWIMLDWKMPHMDGLECAGLIQTRLGQAQPQARPCILLVTAFNKDDARAAAGDVPLADVLTKPVTPVALADCLRRTLTLRPLRPQEPAEEPGRPAPDLLAGARILLVEDHPLNQELARELLHLAGAEVVCVENGALALTALSREGPFDCVLMDCQMPVMDGYTATRKIRQHPQWLHLPVLAMTASALPSDREHALASGMNDHIAKPLDVAQTYQVVSQWVEAGRATRRKETAGA